MDKEGDSWVEAPSLVESVKADGLLLSQIWETSIGSKKDIPSALKFVESLWPRAVSQSLNVDE